MLATTTYRYITVEPGDDAVGVVTLNRPEKRNALSLEVMRELIAAFDALGADRSVKAVILRGSGPAFSAGHDLREMLDRSVDEYRLTFDTCVRLMETIQSIPQPVIAEVAGIATAAGCQLVATCDLAVASTAATFATPGVKIGLFCTTPMVALTRAIGRKRAMEMLLGGRPIDAATAADWGLVNRVVAPDRLAAETRELARSIAGSAGFVVGLGKAAFYAQIDLDQPKAYAYAKEVMSMNALAADAQEGMDAFVCKRPPKWTS
ncbi:MAG TPA: enoyl-CoA hydratase [Candidatus Elarobacter sp.]|jgi:enoyl-CoA hydratase/carnithine racemase|nr:enoyl-CoA hydratase [Candidatus Elarobacter sp.]